MHLADSSNPLGLDMPSLSDLTSRLNTAASDIQPVTITPAVNAGMVSIPSASTGSQNASSGDFWSNLLQTVGNVGTAGLQVFGAIKQSQYLAQAGINPVGYRNGLPVYGSTPAGVTPGNPYSLPSGMALPAGVTPSYGGYAIQPASMVSQTINPLANLLTGTTGTYLMLGSLAIFAIMALQKNRRR